MSLYETLMTWPPERLAKELQGQARENAALKRRVLELEVELFWLKTAQASAPLLTAASELRRVVADAGGKLAARIKNPSATAVVPAPGGFGVVAARPRTLVEAACWCSTCRPVTLDDMRMVLCPTCGNKRCPHANDHRNDCTGSNEPGQPGSDYPRRAATGGTTQ